MLEPEFSTQKTPPMRKGIPLTLQFNQRPSAPQVTAEWLPLMEYSIETGLSLSTLRRHIKAGKVEYRIEQGRYMLRKAGASPIATDSVNSNLASAQVHELMEQLQQAHEEIAELKMLVAIYEDQMKPRIGHV